MFLKVKDCDEPLPREGLDPESWWGMVFDGAVNAYGKGIGVVIITPHGSHIPFTARLMLIVPIIWQSMRLVSWVSRRPLISESRS